jgi:hypothetical protein
MKKEVILFHENYHKKLANGKYFKKMSFHNRIIIPIFYFSMPLGKVYVKILDFLLYTKRALFKNF